MSEPEKKIVEESFLKMLRAEQAKRDAIATEIGVITFNYDNAKRDAYARLERAIREEVSIANHALSSVGIDPESGNYAIDHKTGEVIPR